MLTSSVAAVPPERHDVLFAEIKRIVAEAEAVDRALEPIAEALAQDEALEEITTLIGQELRRGRVRSRRLAAAGQA